MSAQQRGTNPELTIDDLRRIVGEARAGGRSDRKPFAIFVQALEIARARRKGSLAETQ